MTAITGTVALTGIVSPKDTADVYAVTDDIYNRGGFRPVADAAARLAITADRRKVGMWVYQIDTSELWTLAGGILDANWVIVGNVGTDTIRFNGNGTFEVDVRVDGAWIAPVACTILSVVVDVGERGKNDGGITSSIWDVNKNGTTIFTTQSHRPTIATSAGGGEAYAASGAIDVPTLAAGDRVTVDTDVVADGSVVPTNFTIIIKVVY